MKFALDQNEPGNIVRSYEPGKIQIKAESYQNGILVNETEIWTDLLPHDCQSMAKKVLMRIVALQPDIAIFGTGDQQVFPDPRTLIPLMDARIGYEIMDTAAACRTYNVLVSESRKVVALLIP